MKAHVDSVKCEGFGSCHEILPAVFLLDEWGYAHADADGEVPAAQEQLAREAAHKCPVNAIVLRGDEAS